MPFSQGVQGEVLVSLALVMMTGTGLLSAVLLDINLTRVETLHGLLGRGFVAAAAEATYGRPLGAGSEAVAAQSRIP